MESEKTLIDATVRLNCGTIGKITGDSIDFQDPENFIGEMFNVGFYDENGYFCEKEGILVEVLEANYR